MAACMSELETFDREGDLITQNSDLRKPTNFAGWACRSGKNAGRSHHISRVQTFAT